MARHSRPHARIKTRRPRTAYHRTHPWFMTYAYCSASAALLVVLWVWRVIA